MIRIGFLGGSENYEHVQRRLSRWREAVQAEGLTPGPVVHAGGDSATAAAAMLDEAAVWRYPRTCR